MPASQRHGYGQFFTPESLIQFVLDRLEPARVVLDPACGSGRFLLGAQRRWGDVELRGFETDPAALELAQAQVGGHIVGADFLLQEPTGDVDLLLGNPPYVRRRGAKRDLYVDFIERAAAWVRPGGQLALVLSNAWLDVGYGADVRAALHRDWAVEWIVESWAERWFPGAKVHTMLLVARRTDDAGARAASTVKLATVDEALPGSPTVRRTLRQDELPDGPWGPVLREPDCWRAASGRLVPLGELATVRRGFTTNDNRFFYPPADSGVEPECLAPLIKSPRQAPGARVAVESLTTRVIVQPGAGPGLAAWMEQRGRTDAGLRPQPPARLVLVKGYHDRFRQPLFDAPVFADQQLYPVTPRPGVDVRALAAVLNSSLSHASVELAGRVNFGDGVLWLGLADARDRIRIADPRGHEDALIQAFEGLPAVAPRASDWGDDAGCRALDEVVANIVGVDAEPLRAAWATAVARRLRLARA